MSDRELVILSTASQAPTRRRNHDGYLLLWDGEGLLFDPGEGTQRQMLFAGVTATSITHICITHLSVSPISTGITAWARPGFSRGCSWIGSRTQWMSCTDPGG